MEMLDQQDVNGPKGFRRVVRVALAFMSLLVATVFFLLIHVRSEDAPSNIVAKQVFVEGHSLVILTGTNRDSISAMSAVRVNNTGADSSSAVLDVDVASAYVVLGSPGYVTNHFPCVIDLANYMPGPFVVRARLNGEYREILRGTIPGDNPRTRLERN